MTLDLYRSALLLDPTSIEAHLKLGEIYLYLARNQTLTARIGLDAIIGVAIDDPTKRREVVRECYDREDKRVEWMLRITGDHLTRVHQDHSSLLEVMTERLQVFPSGLYLKKLRKRNSCEDVEKFGTMLALYWILKAEDDASNHDKEGDPPRNEHLYAFIRANVCRLLQEMASQHDIRKKMIRDLPTLSEKVTANWRRKTYPIQGILNLSNSLEVKFLEIFFSL